MTMDLKTICMDNLVKNITNLPPQLREEVIGESKKSIKRTVQTQVIKDFKRSAVFVVDDITKCLIQAHKTGKSWIRPKYTENMDDDLYYTCLDIAEHFVETYMQELVFSDRHINGRLIYGHDLT